ncbi:hypothetical protein PBF_01110 [Cytobacillus firmus DS1]|uniref:Uncharacterized protein n=1 Tax=Cytobacillus firmus DS1 TaxID=1307436 RepID=W7LLH1_CYTFI|nr:hypothetical protein PBF_01110 [Cytobacillus firmus DS1]
MNCKKGGNAILKYDIEEILLASNANVGGPTTAAAMAIAKGWQDLIGPILVVGTLGYIIGNYVGTALGLWFSGLCKKREARIEFCGLFLFCKAVNISGISVN